MQSLGRRFNATEGQAKDSLVMKWMGDCLWRRSTQIFWEVTVAGSHLLRVDGVGRGDRLSSDRGFGETPRAWIDAWQPVTNSGCWWLASRVPGDGGQGFVWFPLTLQECGDYAIPPKWRPQRQMGCPVQYNSGPYLSDTSAELLVIPPIKRGKGSMTLF